MDVSDEKIPGQPEGQLDALSRRPDDLDIGKKSGAEGLLNGFSDSEKGEQIPRPQGDQVFQIFGTGLAVQQK
jgi:hypothetical protein